MNLMMLLQMAAEGFGDRQGLGTKFAGAEGNAEGHTEAKTAKSNNTNALTYAELYQKARSAAGLIRAGKFDSVGYVDISTPALPIALFAAAWAGRPFVPLNYRLSDLELSEQAAQISPALVVAGKDYYPKLEKTPNLSLLSPDNLVNAEQPAARPENTQTGAELPQENDWDMDPEKEAVLLYTSGTTGKPKAAILRHKHIVSYVLGSQEFMSADENEASLIAVPPYHIAGISAIATAVYTGRRIIQLPNFTPQSWIQTARQENITHAMVVPTMLWRIVEELASLGETLESVHHISYGGGKMPIDVIEKALEVFPNTNFVNAYGMTETSSTISILGPLEHREAHASQDPEIHHRLSSVGKPLPSMEVSIRNEQGAEVSANEHGEIWVRGEQVSGEYVGQKSRVTQDGWFPTNDGGWLDKEGYLFVEGRLDDIIIKGGENISPGEIEDLLQNHKAIRDACAVGIPDTEWGEAIAVAIVLHKGAKLTGEEVQEFIRENLRSAKVPDKVVFCDEIPYNETGKVLRREIRETLF